MAATIEAYRYTAKSTGRGSVRLQGLASCTMAEQPAPPNFVYKFLTTAPPWPLTSSAPLMIPLDIKDGFMHSSTHEQAARVLQRFYPTDEVMHIVKIPVTGAFKENSRWDPSSTGELFYHLYGEIAVSDADGWTLHEVQRPAGQDWAQALSGLLWLET
ncbi:hypothetical protein BKA62DRAFT_483511 [Auriculariales sp. MPI-PUGE-AT-0066]|nr:hypothetical protein BKA62DRAFT_483511 [Auriculariales sp. MPI-PUGE-AT-0066]